MSRGRGWERFRLGPFREGRFTSALHDPRSGAVLGVALGVSFTVAFLTGLLSHLIKHPPGWFEWPPRPAGLYRITQGVHVATGIASIPLLLAKLWTVYPRFWTWPPLRSVLHAVERVALLALVGGSLFVVFSGVASIARWFPWSFAFPPAHYAAAWIAVGGMVVHAAAKAPATRRLLVRSEPAPGRTGGLSRRGFLGAVGAAAAAITVATVGQTVSPLRRVSVLAPRDPAVGPQGLPVNKTSRSAGVVEAAEDPGYRLVVEGRVATRLELSLDEIRALPSRRAVLPIACVDGWSASAAWDGVRLADLLAMAGAEPGRDVRVVSLQARGPYRSSTFTAGQADDPETLLAYGIDGEPLHIDHGFPVRLIAPNRPGVLQTKWVGRVVVL